MSNLVEIQDLNVNFRTPHGQVHAIRDLNLDIPQNKILGIVGESGSGKSTVIWTITRLLASNAVIESGRILFDGHDILQLEEHELASIRGDKMSVVFQDPMTSQIPVLSYGRQMTDIQHRHRNLKANDKRQNAIDILKRVGIPDPEQRVDQYPHQFSGGMRQRVSIAMALMMDPPLLFADEPTTALDVTMEAQIIHLLRELKVELDATIVLVSHNLGLIAELCDEVAVMYAGEIVEKGSVQQIFYDPVHPYTQALLECDPARVLKQTRLLPIIPGDMPDLHDIAKGCEFAPRCSQSLDLCHLKSPGEYHLKDGQTVRCHLYSDGEMSRGIPLAEAQPSRSTIGEEALQSNRSHHTVGATLLDVSDLRVRFRTMGGLSALMKAVKDPHVDAVLDASISVRAGETVGLVGESGSGKTTMGRTIQGLIQPHSGSIRFDGLELSGLSEAALKPIRRDISLMFQDPVGSLSPRRTIKSLVTEPFEFHGKKGVDFTAEAEKLCDMVRLPKNFLSRYPHELSGGQARRVGVARALALQPRLVIADEPTAGLDVSVQGEVLNLMSELRNEYGLSYLIITHNLPVVRHISDRLAIMYLGRIIEYGDCSKLFEAPAHPYTEALVNGVPRPDPNKRRSLVSIEGEVPSLANRPAGCEFHTRCKYAQTVCQLEIPTPQILSDQRMVRCHFPLTN